mgnify:CR=1 FL=1
MTNTITYPAAYHVLSCDEMTYTEGGVGVVQAVMAWFPLYGWYKAVSTIHDYRKANINSNWVENGMNALVWTTTPWTLPTNLMLAVGLDIDYAVMEENGQKYVLAQALLDEYEKLGVPIRQIVFREGSHGDYYYTNRAAAALNIPALTSEFCFIDNEEDQKFIDSEEDWQKQARAQCNAILYYFTQVQY